MHVIMLATGSMTFVATVSSRLNIFMPPILIQDRDPWDSEHMVLRINSGSITVRHADVRRIRNRSCMNAIDTSASDIVDVSAATMRSRKKSDDHNCVRGICANTSGRVTKTSVAPSSPSLLSPYKDYQKYYHSHHYSYEHIEKRHGNCSAGQACILGKIT